MTDKSNNTELKIYRNQPLNPKAVRHMLAWLAPHIPSCLREEQPLDADIPFAPIVFEDIEDVFEALEHCMAQQQFLIESACLLMGQSPHSESSHSGQASNPGVAKEPLPLTEEAHAQRQSVPCAYWKTGFELSIMAFQHQLEHILWRIEEFLDCVLHTYKFDRPVE